MSQTEEITYLAAVECTIEIEHDAWGMQAVRVREDSGNRHYLAVPKGFVVREGEKTYLPIGIVELDRRKRRALVELPLEADSGFRRLWVPFDNFLRQKETP